MQSAGWSEPRRPALGQRRGRFVEWAAAALHTASHRVPRVGCEVDLAVRRSRRSALRRSPLARRVRRRSTGGTRTATRAAAPQARSRARKTSTTRASSRCSPARCARWRRAPSAARVKPSGRTKFQVVALLAREERARVKADRPAPRPTAPSSSSGSTGSARSWPRPRPATPRCSAAGRGRDRLRRGPRPQARHAGCRRARAAGRGAAADRRRPTLPRPTSVASCRSRWSRASSPTRSSPPTSPPRRSDRCSPACWPRGSCSDRCSGPSRTPPTGRRRAWTLPEPASLQAPGGRELMRHQAQVVAAAAAGHRTFLLADEPGPGQDRPGPARRAGRRRLPAAGRRPQRGEDQLGARGRALDPEPHRHGHPRRRRRRSTASPTS